MPQIVNKKSVLEMAMGAIAEITDYEVERVVANIMDPNTAATAKRKITITLTFAPDDYRQQIGMDAQAKTTLAPIQPVRTSLCITCVLRRGCGGRGLRCDRAVDHVCIRRHAAGF